MVRTCNIKGLNLTFVFRHRWEKKNRLIVKSEFRKYELGIFYEKNKAVSKKNFKTPKNWTLVPTFMLGLRLLVCKCWISVDYNVMHFKE